MNSRAFLITTFVGVLAFRGEMSASEPIALSRISKGLVDPDPWTRFRFAYECARAGPLSRDIVLSLARLTRDPDTSVRIRSAQTLAAIGSQGGIAVPDLVKALSDESQYVRSSAAVALGEIGCRSSAVLKALKQSWHKEKSWRVLMDVRASLYKLGVSIEPSITQLTMGMRDLDPVARLDAVLLLSKLASPSKGKQALPSLVEGLHDPSAAIRIASAEAIGKTSALTVASAIGLLFMLMTDEEELAKETAIDALINILHFHEIHSPNEECQLRF